MVSIAPQFKNDSFHTKDGQCFQRKLNVVYTHFDGLNEILG